MARALIKSPEIILADEPTGALYSESGVQILDILKEISKEKLVIVVSHDKEYAAKYADRIIELSDGRIVSDTVKEGGDFMPTPAIHEKVRESVPDKENIPAIIHEKVTESAPDSVFQLLVRNNDNWLESAHDVLGFDIPDTPDIKTISRCRHKNSLNIKLALMRNKKKENSFAKILDGFAAQE